MTDVSAHLAALQAARDAAVADVALAADAARSAVDGELHALRELTAGEERPPLIAGVPVEEPPPYIPPPMPANANALIPDTPLVDIPTPPSSSAFDDAPLWQS